MQQPRSSLLLEFTLRLDGEVHGPRPGGSVMSRRSAPILGSAGLAGLCVGLLVYGLAAAQSPQQPPQGGTYTFRVVEQGVRVKLPGGLTWERLAAMSPDEIRGKDLFPQGFLPLPHVKQLAGGMIFPAFEITEINKQETRSLERFDADFDLPDHLVPEFPPPVFLSSRPELGDVSRGQLLTIRNYFAILDGILTPVQMEGMRLLLTPFPQQQFNQTDDRKTDVQSLGVTCLDCHSNGHTNAAFHQTPDIRPQAARFRIETVSLRGMFNQLIHGSKRSLRSVEDFTEFEQRTAYFDGDHVIAAKKGLNLPDRASQVAMMAQMQNMFDFPPTPKVTALGTLDPTKATEEERLGQEVFL